MMRFAPLALLAAVASPAAADTPEILAVEVRPDAAGWSFDVTVRHPDTGWDHYADGWDVLAPDGTRLGFRELLHPHETEQPFTRSLSGVVVPEGVRQVAIRARCSVDGWASGVFTVDLPE